MSSYEYFREIDKVGSFILYGYFTLVEYDENCSRGNHRNSEKRQGQRCNINDNGHGGKTR